MILGIDGNEANIRQRVGVNVWGFEVLKELAKVASGKSRQYASGEILGSAIKFLVYLSKPPLADLPRETGNWRYRAIGPEGLWTRWRLPLDLYCHRPRPDVFLSLSHYAPKWCPCPRLVSIMDLSFLKFSEAFKPAVRWQLTNWTRESVKNAARVITISEFNKQEIIKSYGCSEEKINVIYPGVSEIFKGFTLRQAQGESLREKYGIRGKYLLFVGTMQPKKNLDRLIEAFGMVQKDFPDIELVIAGKIWRQFTETKDLEVRSWGSKVGPYQMSAGVRFLGYVPDQGLPGLIAGAEALVLPSLYEGFGIPAVEAMSLRTPVLASNVTSLPEIVGDAGILFDPYDVDQIAKAIVKLLTMPVRQRQALGEKGKIQAKKFDWSKSAESIMKVFYDIANTRPLDSPDLVGIARDDEIK